MNKDEFWAILQEVHDSADGHMDEKCKGIAAAVGRLPARQATLFAEHFEDAMIAAYSWPLWGAAYVIHGGCGDDSFADFRASLVSRGRAQFEAALSDPDSLSDVDLSEDDWVHEGFGDAVTEGVKLAGGERPGRRIPPTPAGQAWAEDAVRSLFPRLAAKYG